jgi:hypothetical protein
MVVLRVRIDPMVSSKSAKPTRYPRNETAPKYYLEPVVSIR